MAKILIIEDDEGLASAVSLCLLSDHHVVDVANDGHSAKMLLTMSSYDLIIMDWNLPDMTGLEICRDARASGIMTAILFLTVKSNLTEKKSAFNAGTDDYLTKPFDLEELDLRIKALLRRPPILQPDTLVVKDLVLNAHDHTVLKGGKEFHLFPRDFALLEFLMRNIGRICSANKLLESVWRSDTEASVDTVRQSLMRIRKMLDYGERTVVVENIHGVGYRLVKIGD